MGASRRNAFELGIVPQTLTFHSGAGAVPSGKTPWFLSVSYSES